MIFQRTALACCFFLLMGPAGALAQSPLSDGCNPPVAPTGVEAIDAYESLRRKYATRIADEFEARFRAGGRYMQKGCTTLNPASAKAIYSTPPELEKSSRLDRILAPYFKRQAELGKVNCKIDILDCAYSKELPKFRAKPYLGRVVMMNPSSMQLGLWIASACLPTDNRRRTDVPMTEKECMVVAAQMIWQQANAQFPISGAVFEENLCQEKHGFFGFRDGVTVGLRGMPNDEKSQGKPENPDKCSGEPATSCSQLDIPEGILKDLLVADVTKLGLTGFARLANMPPDKWPGGSPLRCPGPHGDPTWLTISRDEYLRALGEARYPLLETWLRTGAIEKRLRCGNVDEPGFLARKCPKS